MPAVWTMLLVNIMLDGQFVKESLVLQPILSKTLFGSSTMFD